MWLCGACLQAAQWVDAIGALGVRPSMDGASGGLSLSGSNSRLRNGIVLAALTLVATYNVCCTTGSTPRECLAGEPRAIFEASDSTVVAHDFQSSGATSDESVAFDNGLLLALAQRGCDTLQQEFILSHDSLSVELQPFIGQAIATFYQLATLSPRLEGFAEYGRILGTLPENFAEGAPVDLAPGLSVRIVGLPTPNRPSWRLTITQDLGAPQPPR